MSRPRWPRSAQPPTGSPGCSGPRRSRKVGRCTPNGSRRRAGLYSSDGTRRARLGSERFRAARLVVDTGIHFKGWTRQEAIDY
ncbi:MAG: DUF885 family protein [Gemmatimonadales bacterium]